jgi:hypothetical protein
LAAASLASAERKFLRRHRSWRVVHPADKVRERRSELLSANTASAEAASASADATYSGNPDRRVGEQLAFLHLLSDLSPRAHLTDTRNPDRFRSAA